MYNENHESVRRALRNAYVILETSTELFHIFFLDREKYIQARTALIKAELTDEDDAKFHTEIQLYEIKILPFRNGEIVDLLPRCDTATNGLNTTKILDAASTEPMSGLGRGFVGSFPELNPKSYEAIAKLMQAMREFYKLSNEKDTRQLF